MAKTGGSIDLVVRVKMMPNIQRYRPAPYTLGPGSASVEMIPDPSGNWVRFQDLTFEPENTPRQRRVLADHYSKIKP